MPNFGGVVGARFKAPEIFRPVSLSAPFEVSRAT